MKSHCRYLFQLGLLAVLVGVISGIGATLLGMLLRLIQHSAFGYSVFAVVSAENFLAGVTAASPLRRFIVVFIAGCIGALGWFLLKKSGRPLVSIAEEVNSASRLMTVKATLTNIFLQIITVAMGSPLGREVAPRELGVLITSFILRKCSLSSNDRRIGMGCAAGAALAAIYNVPLGGAFFIMEGVLFSFSRKIAALSFITCALATVISWVGLGNSLQYQVPEGTVSFSLCVWAFIMGPVFGVSGYWYKRVWGHARRVIFDSRYVYLLLLLNFVVFGGLAMFFPALLGNGKSPARLVFDSDVAPMLVMSLLLLRTLFVFTTLKFGAKGGLLTPSLASGALLGALLGHLWSIFFPVVYFEGFALIGAAVFLASAQRMPITAIILLFEFTHIDLAFALPLILSVVSAIATTRYIYQR